MVVFRHIYFGRQITFVFPDPADCEFLDEVMAVENLEHIFKDCGLPTCHSKPSVLSGR